MKKKRLILISFGILLLIPTLASADCLDLGGFTGWVVEGSHTLVFYMGTRPIARLEIPNCTIRPSSSIFLIKSYVCDTDDIMIDNEKCSILTVQVLY
jgi:multisubunit Na+/H+ antiporter MnhB subunit